MTPSPVPLDNPSNRAISSQSLFSRLAAPFQGRSRSFADFEINLDEPLKEYRAGDAVKGNITLIVPKPVRITHLVLSLHGFAKVYKHVAAPGEGLPSEVKTPAPGRGRSGAEYLGNGLISLFEDEVVLCGAGKLGLGQYSFEFEARFPFTGLPSSLSFERGTISYMLVATLTRPTAIAPTMFREKEVQFRETLDVATTPRPKQRKLHLQALKRPRRQPRRALTDRTINSLPNTNQSSTDSSDLISVTMPRSSNASDTSRESGFDSLTLQSVQSPSGSTFNGDVPLSPSQITQNTISASVDVLRGGFLPGDYIPLRILVKHTKALKSMHVVIVTLYRKARIDADPVIESAAAATAESQTRAGFRSLRIGGRSFHLYRMDLAQAFAPLIINPLTLESDIKTAVKIPDHVFPTVSTVPGQMIAFTYHVEVIMDLGGKFSKHERLLSRLNMTNQAPVFSVGAKTSESEHGLPATMEMYHLIDTSEIRREKGVAQETFEVLVGSVDSKRKAVDAKKIDLWVDGSNEQDTIAQSHVQSESHEQTGLDLGSSPQYRAATSNETIQRMLPPATPRLILPDLEEPIDEKARIRLAEERLLPSAPPESEDFATGSSSVPFALASAPLISDLEAYNGTSHQDRTIELEQLGLALDDEIAPAYEREFNTGESSSAAAVPMSNGTADDKTELERQRLLAMASSPDDLYEDPIEALPNISVPSAPLLEDTVRREETHDPQQAIPIAW